MPTKERPRAAIYARISDARDGDTDGVERQVEDCVRHCESEGYEVTATFVDNNRSAYKPGGKRPRYDALIGSIQAGEIDVLVCWDTTRLYRQLRDLEHLVDVLGPVRVDALRSGRVDLSTADGRLHARMMGVVNAHESEKRGERVARAAQQRAERGKFSGGVRRFGYNSNCTDLEPAEAELLRQAYIDVAAGASVRSVWRKWTELDVRGTQGAKVSAAWITTLLKRPMNAGLASFHGEVLAGESQAPVIIDQDTFVKVQAILSDPARRTVPRGRPAKALMAGYLTCGVCGDKCYRHIRGGYRERNAYACRDKKCAVRLGRIVDDFVVQVIGEWLNRNADKVSRPKPRARASKSDPAAQAQQLRQKLDDLALLLAAGDLDAVDYAKATREVRARLSALEERVMEEQGMANVRRLADTANVQQAWIGLDTDGKRAVIGELMQSGVLDSVILEPSKRDGDAGLRFQWGKS